MSTVRTDFFLDPEARLTEQERALMTAMLADLVAAVADEIRVAAQVSAQSANDAGANVFERLIAGRLLDIPDLIALLLCRAGQERVSATIRPRGTGATGGPAGFLHGLAASDDADVSAAAMAVILGRSRRRDRFHAPRIDLDDVPADAAVRIVNSVTAALRFEEAAARADNQLAQAACAVLAGHDEGKSMDALVSRLVQALDRAGRLDDDALRVALADGELGIFAEALSRRAGIETETGWSYLAGGGRELACLLRMAAVPRSLAAEIAIAMDGAAAAGPAEVIGLFDSLASDDVERASAWLRLDSRYREAMCALGGPDGNAAD